jgi:hypothetical protein
VLYVGHAGAIPSQYQGNPYDAYDFFLHSYDPNDPDDWQNANPIWDYNIYDSSSPPTNFVFLWACALGNERGSGDPTPHGMAYCWNPNTPSSGEFFISFSGASPWLLESMGRTDSNGNPYIYKYWLVFFYYFALNPDPQYWGLYDTVSESMDMASYMCGSYNGWNNNPALNNFQTYWPYNMTGGMQAGNYTGSMVVYGDPNMVMLGNVEVG